jgi:F-type H+-transporting ATPase subunit b
MGLLFAAEEGAAGGNGYLIPHVIDEFIWGTVAFSIVLALFLWKGLPAIRAAMAANTARIEGELASAEQARSDAEAELQALTSSLGDAGAEAEAVKLEADLIARAEADALESKERARIDVAAQREQALADLRAAVAAQARSAADAVVRNNLDDNTQRSLIDDYISRVGAG